MPRLDDSTARFASSSRPLRAAECLLIALAILAVTACDEGRRAATPLEQGKVREIDVVNRHVGGGGLDAQVREGDPLDLRIFVSGAGGPGGIVHLNGYGIAARVKRHPGVPGVLGFWARLTFSRDPRRPLCGRDGAAARQNWISDRQRGLIAEVVASR